MCSGAQPFHAQQEPDERPARRDPSACSFRYPHLFLMDSSTGRVMFRSAVDRRPERFGFVARISWQIVEGAPEGTLCAR
jgi:hypothetical protein